jgi:site-specific DNA-methyltransferase (adenine-specific)
MGVEKVQIGECTLYRGKAEDVLPVIPAASVDCVITSPPYAEQRAAQYGGIPESQYSQWTVGWMSKARPTLKPKGSALINIREHVSGGQISDYVHRTRLALREDGWLEPDELIWIKPDGMPVGRVDRPRRSWERVLWFALLSDCHCFPKANGQHSNRIGLAAYPSRNAESWIHGNTAQSMKAPGVSRCRDWVSVPLSMNCKGEWRHPAAYPEPLAKWLLSLVTAGNAIALDPFMGSGTTGIACVKAGRKFIGIEKDARYFDIACRRIEKAYADAPLLQGGAA